MKKNIIINMRNLLVLALSAITLSSCLLDDTKTDFGKGSNFVGFASPTAIVSAVATGGEVNTTLPVQILGPSVNKLEGDITVNVNIDPSRSEEHTSELQSREN